MVSSDDLVRRARDVVNPRKLSPSVGVGDVACALVTEKGTVYVGVSIDTACSMGFCAEHNAIGNMITNGESRIVRLAAVDWNGNVIPPCGRCREFIYQVDPRNADTAIVLSGGREMKLRDLLPEHWALPEG
jgi:cytidine deaminase